MPYRTFSLNEVAEYLHLPRADVEHLVRQDEIPFEYHGKRMIFRKINVDAWASKRILGLSDRHLREYHDKISVKTHELSSSHSIVSELLKKNAVYLDLVSRTKPSLLRDMVTLAEKTGLILNSKALLQSLEQREKMCSTALAEGFALLHPRHHDPYMFEDSLIAFGRTVRPLPFGAPDGKETDIFFLICCRNDRLHLHVLSRLCLMCRQNKFLTGLRRAANPAEIYECFRNREMEAIRQNGAGPGH